MLRGLLLCAFFIIFPVQPVALAFDPQDPECLVAAKPGGGHDITCTLVANSLLATNLIDTEMLISYKPGGIGAVAFNYIAGVNNRDDQLLVGASSGSVLNIATRKFGQYGIDAVRWLGAIGADYGAIAVRQDAPWNSLSDLLVALKHEKTDLIIGGGGSVGSQDWMKTALIAQEAGVSPKQIRYVAYEGGGDALAALEHGYINVFTGDISEMRESMSAGKIKVLAVLTTERLPGEMSSIPSAKEQGINVQWTIWRGFYVGGEVTDESYAWWINTLKRLVRSQEFRQEREKLGLYPFAMFGAEFENYVNKRVGEYQKIAAEIGIVE